MYPRTGDVFTNVNVECGLLCHVVKVSQKNYVAKKFLRADTNTISDPGKPSEIEVPPYFAN